MFALQKDPESLLSGMRVDNLGGLFHNEPEDFQDNKFLGLFRRFQEITNKLPIATADRRFREIGGRLPTTTAGNINAVSFGCEYKVPRHGLSSFAKYLMECSNAFHNHPGRFLSPYVALVQSSMYGKTRLMREIAYSYYRTVYLCLRDLHSSGYPPRTQGAFTHLFAEPSSGDEYVYFPRVLADRFKRLVRSALENLPDPLRPEDPAGKPK